jgi:hypothetical protein
MLQLSRVRINFPSTTGRVQQERRSVSFSRPIRIADIAINGWDISYRNGDHHLLQQKIDCLIESIVPSGSGSTVNFRVDLLLRDSSGNIDDPFGGYVDVLVIADTQ